MRKIFVLLLLLVLPWTAEAAVVWFAGAETGDTTEFAGVGSNGTPISSGIVRSGNYAYACGQNFNCFFHTKGGLALVQDTYVRLYWRWTNFGGWSNNQNFALIQLVNNVGVEQMAVLIGAGTTIQWRIAGGSVQATGSWIMAAGTWYLIECHFKLHATAGGSECKIDGLTQWSDFTKVASTNGTTTDSLYFQRMFGQTTTDNQLDDVAISNSGYIGRGRVLARQGTAGSPTYTAWTKNACTSSLIENCWSSTSYSNAQNASSVLPNDAQTMLVAPFSSTQSGHGTETVGVNDVINGCKAAVIAKASTGSQMKIRHRIGGVDTDTTVTLNAGDAYYDDGVWAATYTQINAAEVGVVQFSGP